MRNKPQRLPIFEAAGFDEGSCRSAAYVDHAGDWRTRDRSRANGTLVDRGISGGNIVGAVAEGTACEVPALGKRG